jgi:hypothetical protein
MRIWLPLLSIAALGSIVWLGLETRRLAELAGRNALAAEAAQAELAAAVAASRAAGAAAAVGAPPPQSQPKPEPQPAPPATAAIPPDQDPVRFAELALELATTKSQLAAVTQLLEQRNAEVARRAAAANTALQPLPEGVRTCLETLHACLRDEGFGSFRFLSAQSLDQDGLHGVELLDSSDQFGAAILVAERMTARVDRAASRLELRFYGGHRTVGGAREAFAEEGFPLLFPEVDGRVWEARLPYLVRGEGSYPQPTEAFERPTTDVDPATRRQWLERLDRLLAMAGTPEQWRVSRFRGMDRGEFLQVELVGTDDKHRVLAGVHCERLAVEVDRRGVVSLLLRSGVLLREGVESKLTAEGYRMLLPKLTPKQATDAMLGMVVTQ